MLLAQSQAMPMIRRTTKLLSLILVIAGVALQPSQGQQSYDTNKAEAEAILREEISILLSQKLEEAKASESEGKIETALKQYNEALAYVDRLGGGVDPADKAQAAGGVVRNALLVANAYVSQGNYREAQATLNRVLKVDPKNASALALKPAVDQRLDALKGMIPSEEVQQKVIDHNKTKIAADTLIQDARVLIDAGLYDEASDALDAAKAIDPGNTNVLYFTNILRELQNIRKIQENETQFKEKISEIQTLKSWPVNKDNLPIPNSFGTTNLIHSSKGRSKILNKLNKLNNLQNDSHLQNQISHVD